MTIQIAVRMQDENVQYVDEQVASGRIKSRAAYFDRLVARERRRKQAVEDNQKMLIAGPDPEMDAIAAWRSAHPLDLSHLD